MKTKTKLLITLYIVTLLILPFVFKENRVEFNDIGEIVKKNIDDTYNEQNKIDLYQNYDIDKELYRNYISYVAKSYMDVYEVTIFEVSNTKDIPIILNNIKNYLNNKRETFIGYGNEQIALIDKSYLEVKDNYVILIVGEKDLYKKIDELF